MKSRAGLTNGASVAARRGRPISAPARFAERRAWVILCAAFLTWCVLAAIGLSALASYRATAAEPQRATISVSRGLASYLPSPGAEPRLIAREHVEVLEGTVVQSGPNSQAAITLFDGSQVRLLAGTRLGLEAMHTGRFDAASTRLGLRLEDGPALFAMSGALPSGGAVVGLGDAQVRLDKGAFLLWAEPGAARISVYEGSAVVSQRDRQVALAAGQRAVAWPGLGLSNAWPLDEDLLLNGDFSQGFQGWKPLDDLEVQNDSLGRRRLVPVEVEGQPAIALRVTRETSMNRHAKTGLIQEVNRDVRGFRSLKLRARLQVLSSKLDGGGYAGTEYPMTFVVYYVDDKGGEPNWMHGFFYKNAEHRPAQFGQPVPQGTWLDYEVELMNQPDRPAFIKSIWVLGAGHDFDAQVTDLQLLAR
ncbi:MAG: FecR domain-containing protein [Chloroflexi bacterium]|nr:FecR domain-containing protein [Chloroflexota bacterium]